MVLHASEVTDLETWIQKAYNKGGPREVAWGLLLGWNVEPFEYPATPKISDATRSLVAQAIDGLERQVEQKGAEEIVSRFLTPEASKEEREAVRAKLEAAGLVPTPRPRKDAPVEKMEEDVGQ